MKCRFFKHILVKLFIILETNYATLLNLKKICVLAVTITAIHEVSFKIGHRIEFETHCK